jgi:hypothetical protein
MTEAPGTPQAHPFRTAWATRDIDAWAEHLADDIVVKSPLIRSDFRGSAAARELFDVLFAVIPEFAILREFRDGDASVFVWRARAQGRTFDGVDVIRSDDRGAVTEIAVYIRTLVGLADFAAVVGPALGRRQGRLRSWLLTAMSPGLRLFMTTSDTVATKLVQRGRGPTYQHHQAGDRDDLAARP